MCKCPRLTRLMIVVSFASSQVTAHPADTTPLRIQIQPKRVDLRFTLTLLTLGRMASLDLDGDHQLSPQELESCMPKVAAFLQEHVLLKINQRPVTLGEVTRFEALWPPTPSVDLRAVDRAVDVAFQLTTSEVIANLGMEFTSFPKLGELATIQAIYEQGDLLTQVTFTPGEPDYLYDTGFAVEDIFRAPQADFPKSSSRFLQILVVVSLALSLAFAWIIFRKPTKGDPSSTP